MNALGWMNRESRVFTILLREGPLTIKEIADRTEMSYANVWNVLQVLVDEQHVRCSGPKRRFKFDIAGRA